jgi:hypothetical protein
MKLAAALSAIMLSALVMISQGAFADTGPQNVGLIGKVSATEGQLLRYVPQVQDWVPTVKDTPFGLDDTLSSGSGSRAEIINPNNTWLRIGGDTVIHLLKLNDDFTEVDVSTGVGRLYNRSSSLMMKVTTPFGYVIVHPESTLDVYVGSETIELFTLQGKAEYVSAAGDSSKYEISLGSPVISNGTQVAASSDAIDPQWDGWNMARNNLILTRVEVRGASADMLPRSLQNEASLLEENGVWEEVYSESCKCREKLWRPTKVSPGWRPFTSGRWVEIYGENCWVPDEPFGYVTHHYGNWEFIGGKWYWAPPGKQPQPLAVAAEEPAPAKPPQPAVVATEEPPPAEQPQPAVVATVEPPPPVVTEPAWYPGRVGWFYSETEIGWVPLAPQEQFYSVNNWGPQAVVADDGGSQGNDLPSYDYYDAGGVAVERDNLYHVDNYTTTRMTGIHDIDPSARTFKRMPTASAREAGASDKSRFSAGQTASGQSKPSQSVISRIRQTKATASENSGSVKSSMSRMQTAKPGGSATSAMKRPEAIARSANRTQPETANSPSANASSQPASGKADNKAAVSRRANTSSASRASGRNVQSSGSQREERSDMTGQSRSERQMHTDSPGRSVPRTQARTDSPRQSRTERTARSDMSGRTGGQSRTGAANPNMRNPGRANVQRTSMPKVGAPKAGGATAKKK